MKLCGFFIFCCIAAGELIAANSDVACKKGCPQPDNGLLQYVAGQAYEYKFDSVMTVSLSDDGSTDADNTKIKVEGAAKVFAEGNCGYTLQLNSVAVTAPKESTEKKILEHIQKPIHFTLVSGKVQPEICTHNDDSTYALNVKRAIISLLQSNTEPETDNEVDVFGLCPTQTTVSKIDGTQVITKVRNLNSCAYREQLRSGLLTGIINDKSDVRSSMLLLADYSKELKLENGLIRNVHLVEDYKFQETAKNAGGSNVHARVETSLNAKSASGVAAAAPATGNRVASIMFQQPEVYTSKNIEALKSALAKTVQMVENYVQNNAGQQFGELIRLMRSADTSTLLDLATMPHPNKNLARKVYLDALFRTGTAQSAKAVINQLSKMDEREKKFAIFSLNLVQSVDKETINQITVLLNTNLPKEIYMVVGSIVSKYCERNGCQEADVEIVSKKFTDALKHCKANTKRDEERIVYALKGIGNAQSIASSASSALIECSAVAHSSRIRVAALQALSAAKCDDSQQQKVLQILQDRNEDSEVRIEAYLAAINCPNAELANQIAAIVNSETVNQVGGFISSSLKAIRDSTDATRESQRYFLKNVRVTKKFPKDLRRYSFNDELSYKLDSLGVSSSADYKLIYSQHGFLPRSARLNVSTEIFGTKFNAFEASIRQENLEHILEYYMGPKGLLNMGIEDFVGTIPTAKDGSDTRGRRSIADDTAKLAKKYKTYGAKNGGHDINLDLSLKLFGSEMFFMSLGDNIPTSVDDLTKQISSIYDNVKKGLSSFNKEFNMHSILMDTEIIYATGIGFPLELSAQGFAASKIDFGIEFDVDGFLNLNWQDIKYRLKVVPSVDVSINFQLGFNTQVLKSGARFASNLHSAVGSDMHLEFTSSGPKGFNIDIELPREKMELIDLQSVVDLFIAEADKNIKSIPLKAVQNNKPEVIEDCFSQLENAGFSVCFETNIGDVKGQSLSPNGVNVQNLQPFTFSLYVIGERKLNLKGQYIDESETGSHEFRLIYSTPGSQVSHDTTLALKFANDVDHPWELIYVRASFEHPNKHVALELGFKNSKQEAVIYLQLEHNKEVKKSRIGFIKNGNQYIPVIQVIGPKQVYNDIQGISVDGRIVVEETNEKNSRYNFENIQLHNMRNNARVVVNGWVDVGPGAYLKSELHVAPGQNSFLIITNFKVENNEYSAGMFINDEKSPENVLGGMAHVKIDEHEVNVDVTAKGGQWKVESNNAWKVQFEDADEDAIAPNLSSIKFKNNFSVMNKNNFVGGFKLSGSMEEEKVDVSAEVIRGKKIASVTLKYDENQQNIGDYHLSINGKLNKHFIDILATGDVKDNSLAINNVVTTSWGTSLTVKGELGQGYTAQDVYVALQGTFQYSGKEKATQWILKINGTPDKVNGELKITRDSAELVKYIGEIQHQADKITSGMMNMQVKNNFVVKADIKTNKNGRGELNANIEMLKPKEPKHKIEVNAKFQIQSPRYDLDTVIVLDSDKIILLKTENIVDKLKFSTKNSLDIANRKYSLDVNGAVKGEWQWNGELNGNVAVGLPEERLLSGSIKRKITTNPKTGLVQGTMDVKVSAKRDEVTHSLALSSKLEKGHLKKKEFAVETECIYENPEGKKINLKYHVKHLPKGQNKMIDLGGSLKGDLIPETSVDVSLTVDEYSSKHAIYRSSIKSGSQISAIVNGNYNIGEPGKPASYEVQGVLQVPESAVKSIELNSYGKYLKPEVEGGSYLTEVHIDQKTGHDQFSKFNLFWKGARNQAVYNIDLQTDKMPGQLKLEGSFEREKHSIGSGRRKYVFNGNYGEKYIKKISEISYTGSGDTVNIHYTLDSSSEMLKDIDVLVRGVKDSSDNSYSVQINAKKLDSVYTFESKYYRSMDKKGLEIHATLPNGKPVVLVGLFELLEKRKVKLTLDVDNLGGLDLKSILEAAYQSVDNFYIKGQLESARLGLNGMDLDVRSQGDIITINLKDGVGVILAGKANYLLKKEEKRAILEAQGQLQYKGSNQNSFNFKIIRQEYEMAIDKEVGFSYNFNGNFGPKNAVSTLKFTDKDFNIKFSVCEEKKQCTNIQVQSVLSERNEQPGASSEHHSVLVLIDLRELGYPHEFELQSKIIRQGLKSQYSLQSSIISNNNMKYQVTANVLPSSSTISIKLPTREMLLDMQQLYPRQGEVFGHYENSVAIYLDKTRKPDDVTRLLASVDVNGERPTSIAVDGLLKFEHPSIRPLSVTGKLNIAETNVGSQEQRVADVEIAFDIFRVAEEKVLLSAHMQDTTSEGGHYNVTSTSSLKSSGLGFQYEINERYYLDVERQEVTAGAEIICGSIDVNANWHLFAGKNRNELSLNALNQNLFNVVNEFSPQKHALKVVSRMQILDQKPLQLAADIHASLAKISVKSDGLLDANAELKVGKDVNFKIVGAGNEMFSGQISLDAANFLQTSSVSNEENIKTFLQAVETEGKQNTEKVREEIKKRTQAIRDVIDKQIQLAGESSPDFSQLKANYVNHVKDILSEIESDPSVKDIIETYRKLYTTIARIVTDLTKTSVESYEKLHESLIAVYTTVEVTIRDTLLPICEELSLSMANILRQLSVELINILTRSTQALLNILEKCGPILTNYGKVINESLKPFNELAQELSKIVVHAEEEILTELKDLLSKLPTLDALRGDLKRKLGNLDLSDNTLNLANNFFEHVNVLPQTPETSEFLQRFHDYIKAKSKRPEEKIIDEKMIPELLDLFEKAVRSILAAALPIIEPVRGLVSGAPVTDFNYPAATMTVLVDLYRKLPMVLSLRFSVINFLLSEDLENVVSREDILLASRALFSGFELKGHVADGRHVFTFDGAHITVPGSCKYVLSQDSNDNNFTVVANLNNGKMKSIILTDRDGGIMEINDAGVLKVSGAVKEYPHHSSGQHAWRQFYTVWMLSEYGVQVMCTSDLKVCHVNVNGFYTSKTRGLLGNGNAEPNDDLLQVDGTIASSVASFVSGYGIGKCNPIQSNEEAGKTSPERTELCSEIFGIESSLVVGYLLINPAPYRDACDNAVLAAAADKDKESAACTIAMAYGSALNMEDDIVELPSRCLKCPGAAGQRDLDQEFTTKIPNNKADLVFVVDTEVAADVTNLLVAPVITDIREALKTRGLSDVHLAIIAYNPQQRYPALITSDNGKLNAHSKFGELKLNGPKNFCGSCAQVASDKKLQQFYELLESLFKSIVPQSDEKAFRMALNYPFRAGAAKTIIGVRSNSLSSENLLPLIRTHLTNAETNFDGAILHLIGPVNELSLEGVPEQKLVGFNARLFATLEGKDNKKRPKLKFREDMGIEFVLDNGGWVFTTQNIDKLKPDEQKKAVNQVTNTIADSLFKTEIISECKCVPLHGLHAQHKCVIKSSNFVPNKKPKAV